MFRQTATHTNSNHTGGERKNRQTHNPNTTLRNEKNHTALKQNLKLINDNLNHLPKAHSLN